LVRSFTARVPLLTTSLQMLKVNWCHSFELLFVFVITSPILLTFTEICSYIFLLITPSGPLAFALPSLHLCRGAVKAGPADPSHDGRGRAKTEVETLRLSRCRAKNNGIEPKPGHLVQDQGSRLPKQANKKLSYRRGTAWCVLSVVILPITTQQCRHFLYDKSWPNRWYEVGGWVGVSVS